MNDYLLESVKLQRIDFFMKLVATSDCDEEEKYLAIQWVSELTDELMAKLRSYEHNRSIGKNEL
ncbi:levan regulatory protein [bacteria symbiont BFo1 of Frankliniella occidentalis]|nr:levan regulatory protein [bacteria symbiont BFo1 of Frankliniella occidentalis]